MIKFDDILCCLQRLLVVVHTCLPKLIPGTHLTDLTVHLENLDLQIV